MGKGKTAAGGRTAPERYSGLKSQFLVVGCGSIGQRHIRNLRKLGIHDIAAFDSDPEQLDQVTHEHAVIPCSSLEAGLVSLPEVTVVCTPPHLHTVNCQKAVEAGSHVFIEKPIANSLDGLAQLLQSAALRKRILYVGYNLRFNAGLRKMKELLDHGAIGRALVIRAEAGQYLPDWRPAQDYRNGYIVNAATGGGILLDASHELDYVRWLGGEVETAYCVADHLSTLEMETEDTAAITLRLQENVLAEIHLDCIQRGYTRNCKVIGEEGTLFWDFKTGVRLLNADKHWQEFPLAPDPNEMYVEEMSHFLACVRGEAEPLVDGATGKRVLEIALAARKSAATGTQVVV